MRDRKHQTYSLEFKRHAVMLALHPEIATKDVAEANIHPFMLSRWKKEMRIFPQTLRGFLRKRLATFGPAEHWR